MPVTDKYFTEQYTRNYLPGVNECGLSSIHQKGSGFMSKIFSSNNNRKKELKMPFELNTKSDRILSPPKVGRLKPIGIYYENSRGETFVLKPVMNLYYPELEMNNSRGDGPDEIEEKIMPVPRELSKTEKLLKAFSRDNTFLDVSVEDRGTDSWNQATKVDQGTDPCQRTMFDRGTDPIDPAVCTLPACQLERKLLDKRVEEKERAIVASFQEGCNLLKEMYKIKEAVCEDETSEGQINENPGSVDELAQLSYTCLKEISTQLSLTQKHTRENAQYLTDKLAEFERGRDEAAKETAKDKAKIKRLKKLFSGIKKHEENVAKIGAENERLREKQIHVKCIEDQMETLTDHLREFNCERGARIKTLKNKVGRTCSRRECPFGSNYIRQNRHKPRLGINKDTNDYSSQYSLDSCAYTLELVDVEITFDSDQS